MFKHILTAVDLGDSSIAPLHFTEIFARQYGSEVTLFHADELATLYADYDPAWVNRNISPTEETGRLENELRDLAAENMRGIPPPRILVLPEHPVHAIVKTARDRQVDLIIMGTHGRRGWRRALVGSIADGVVRAAEQPVLVVPEHRDGRPDPQTITRVVCPVNFSDAARDAVGYAGAVAETFDAELILVHVVETAWSSIEAAAIEVLFRGWLPEELRPRCAFRELVLRGGPAERVLDCVEDVQADLLVIGAQLKWLRSESVIGTTSERLLRFSPVPVLTVTRRAVDTARGEEKPAETRQEVQV